MSQRPEQASRAGAFARWVAKQAATRAVALALGAPAVTSSVMGWLAYANGLPLAWGFFAVMAVAAFTSTLLNQARSFLVAYSAAGKISMRGGELIRAISKLGTRGYGVSMIINNHADITLEYRVKRVTGHIEGRAILQDSDAALDGDTIEIRGGRVHSCGIAKMDPLESATIHGEIEIHVSYGRPGKLNYLLEETYTILGSTNDKGQTKNVRFILSPGKDYA